MKRNLLFFTDPADAGGGQGAPASAPAALPVAKEQPPQSPAPPAPPVHQAPTPPPAASIVHSGKSEREVNLEQELEDTRRQLTTTAEEKKAREVRINELEDELRALKGPAPKPAAAKSSKRVRLTLFSLGS